MISNVYDWFVNEEHLTEPTIDPFYNAYGHDIVIDVNTVVIPNEDGEMEIKVLKDYSFM